MCAARHGEYYKQRPEDTKTKRYAKYHQIIRQREAAAMTLILKRIRVRISAKSKNFGVYNVSFSRL
jgi:hypothetical protein